MAGHRFKIPDRASTKTIIEEVIKLAISGGYTVEEASLRIDGFVKPLDERHSEALEKERKRALYALGRALDNFLEEVADRDDMELPVSLSRLYQKLEKAAYNAYPYVHGPC